MGHGAEPPFLQRQDRLGAAERLDLALLVERQGDGVGGRIDKEADNVSQLLDEQRIVRELTAARGATAGRGRARCARPSWR